jgi:exodeoxyribonuclease VII small subunit
MTAKPKTSSEQQTAVQATLAIDEPEEVRLPETFEAAYAELQEIVTTMESGQMSLADSLSAYKRGDTLLQFCQKTLSGVEQQVQILNAQNTLDPYQADDNHA